MTAASPNASTPVPMLDVNRQNGPLAAEFQAKIDEIARTGSFVNGPAVKAFEAAMAEYCGVEHAIGCASGRFRMPRMR